MPSQAAPTTTHITERSPDTGVLVLILKYAQHIDPVILFDSETGNKQRLHNVKHIVALLFSSHCLALLHWM